MNRENLAHLVTSIGTVALSEAFTSNFENCDVPIESLFQMSIINNPTDISILAIAGIE